MSLLKLASLHSVENFRRNTAAISSFAGRFAVRSADTDHRQIKLLPVCRRQFSERNTRIFDDQHRAPRQSCWDFAPFKNHHRCRTFVRDFVNKIVTVKAFTFDGKKQITFLCCRESVQTFLTRFHRARAGHQQHRPRQQISKSVPPQNLNGQHPPPPLAAQRMALKCHPAGC